MTCIATYKDLNGNIWMGGDSLMSGGTDISITAQPKIFRLGNMLFGFCGYPRALQVLQYQYQLIEHNNKLSDYEYIVSVFIDSLMKTFEEAKVVEISNNLAMMDSTMFILAYNKKVYIVQDNFQIIENNSNYNAIGCGAYYANAAFWMMENMKIKPEKKIVKALECAENFSLVKRPFYILKLEHTAGRNF